MKFLFTVISLLVSSYVIAQSPAYHIVFQLKDTVAPYQIKMKFCKPKQSTGFKDRFAHDTSKIRWELLSPNDYTCGEYFTGETIEYPRVNSFTSANQAMLWENILVFSITSARHNEPMYILVPIFIQSFVTSVIIKDIPFKPGIYELDNVKTIVDGMKISLQNNRSQTWGESQKRKYKVELK